MLKNSWKFVKIVFFIFAVSFFIQLFWEVAHSFLYDWASLPLRNDIYYYIPRILVSSLGDAFIMLGIYGLGLMKNKKVNWISKLKPSDYALVLISGLFISVFIEELNVNFLGRWAYTKLMPLIPGLNIGLTPVLQMLVLPLFIFKTLSFFKIVDKWA